MSFKKTMAMLLTLAILLVNGACIPAWAEEPLPEAAEAVPVEAPPAPASEPEPAPPAPAPAPEPEPAPAPAPAPAPEKAPDPAPAPEPAPEPKAEPEPASEPAPEPESSAQDAPTDTPAQDVTPAQGEEPVQGDDTVHSDDPTVQGGESTTGTEGDPEGKTDGEPSETTEPGATEEPGATGEPGATEEPGATGEPGATEEPGATDVPVVDPTAEAPGDPTAEPVVEDVATQAPAVPAEITSLSAAKEVVIMGESAGFNFSVKNAVSLSYRLTAPSGGVDAGSLPGGAGSYSFTASQEGRYTFELFAAGESGGEVSASASLTSVNAPALTLSVKPNAPSCHGGDSAVFNLSVTEGLELKSVAIKATLGGKVFYESAQFTPCLSVDVPATGRVSEVGVSVSVTDVYGRSAEKRATIPCAVHDPESRAEWEATMKGVKKTGVWPEDLVAIAKTQIGYTESSRDFGPKYDGGVSGYTRYGDWYGMPYEEWCAMFACFCMHYAGIEEENFPYVANCQRWINKLRKMDLYAPRGSYTPKVGDLAFFDWELDNDSDHVGIIFALDYDDYGEVKGVRTIEGNSKGYAVYDGKYYSIKDNTMIGFGLINRAYGHEIEKTHRDVSFESEDFTVNLGIDPEAKVPAFAELNVREILPGDASYDSMLSELRGKLGESALAYARFLAIDFVDETGNDVTVKAPLTVEVTFNEKMVGDKGLTAGVAGMSGSIDLNTDVDLNRKKSACAFSFTQDVNDVLCLYAAGSVNCKEGTLKAKQGQQSVTVSYTAEAMIPEGAELDFHEIEPNTEAYDACVAMMGEAMPGEGVTTRFFAVDVSLNGIPVRPAVPVSVTLDGSQKAATAELVRVKDGAELVCQGTPRKGRLVVDFNADRFGTFAVVYSY